MSFTIYTRNCALIIMDDKPVISVIVPAHNEENYIASTLKSLKSQDFSLPYEIIVVDNASSDRTFEIAKDFGVKVVKEPHLGLTWARERGYLASQADILAYIDADTIASKDWLSVIYKDFQEHPEIVALSGAVYFYDWQQGLFDRLFSYIFEKGLIMKIDRALRKVFRKGELLWGANFALKRQALEEAGGFNKNVKFYGEDTELSLRLLKIGKIKFDKNLVVHSSARRFKKRKIANSFYHLVGYFREILIATPLYSKQKERIMNIKKHLSRKRNSKASIFSRK